MICADIVVVIGSIWIVGVCLFSGVMMGALCRWGYFEKVLSVSI